MSGDVINTLQTQRLDAIDEAKRKAINSTDKGDKMTADELLERMEDLDKVAS